MKKQERKRRLKEKKRRAKEAKKARNAEAAAAETTSETGAQLEQAKSAVREARRIADARALRMLERAAEVVEDILETTQHALDRIPMEMRLQARRIINEQQEGAPKDRPRQAQNPVVNLMKMSMQAANLLTRILKMTNPDVVKLARAA